MVRMVHRVPRKQTTNQKATKALKLARQSLNSDLRFVRSIFPTAPDATPSVTNLTAMAQGDADSTRDGLIVVLKSIRLQGIIDQNASASGSNVRILIAIDRLNIGTLPVIGDLIASAADFFGNDLVDAKFDSRKRFRVLYDRNFNMSDTGNHRVNIPFWSKKLSTKVVYSGTASTDEGPGQVIMFMSSNEATNTPGVDGSVVIEYYA